MTPSEAAHDRTCGALEEGSLVGDRRESAELLRQLAANLREVFWVSDPSFSKVLYASPAFEELWRMPRARLYDDPLAWRDAVVEEDLATVDAQLARQARGEACEAEFRIRLPDGAVRWIWGRSFPWVDARGGARVAGIAEDVTERRHAEEARLAHAERQREALVREIHHRVKNSLQGVYGLLERFAERHPELAGTLAEAMGQVSSIATIHALQGHSPCGRVLLCELVPMIARHLQGLFESPIEIAIHNSRSCVAFLAEREAAPLAIAINELLTNAVKHQAHAPGMPPFPVSVAIGGDEMRAEIRITNRGVLPPGFDFARGAATGLGLDLVKALLPPQGAAVSVSQSHQSGGLVEAVIRLAPPAIGTDPHQPPRS